MKNIRLGLIGVGKWGQNYIKTIEKMSNVELVAVCRKTDCRPDFIPTNCSFHTDFNDFQYLKLDGIIVSSNNPPNLIIECLKFGIPVLGEKPALINYDQIVDFVRHSENKKLLINYIHLFNSSFETLKEIVEYKKIIRICSSGFGPSKTRDEFSPLWDYGPHDLSMILTLMKKEPSEVFISSRHKSREGQTYRINLNFDGVKTKSIVGNGTLVKSRYLSVEYEDEGKIREIVYDDLAEYKLTLDRKPVDIAPYFTFSNGTIIDFNKSPLQNAIEEFVAMIQARKIDTFYADLTVKITKILSTYQEE